MSRIVLATASTDLLQGVRDATGGAFLALPPGPLPTDPAHLFAQLGDAPIPDVIVLDSGPARDQEALDLAVHFQEQCPAIAVVLVSDRASEIGLAAMRAGVRDILHPEAQTTEIR
ncbi:MinD/ParA family protein, partial [Georgenia sp. 10Sc9-8]|nr:MinD/ParA family protein [Georgenia halotolerans]